MYQLCGKLVECVESSCRSSSDQLAAVNSCRLLTRIIPFMLEVGIMIF